MSEQKAQQLITKNMNLGEAVRKYPQIAEILLEYGLHCAGCFANQFDTIEQGALIHGLSEEEVEEMIYQINRVIKNPLDNS